MTTDDAPTLDLPASVVEQLVSAGIQAPAGQIVLATIFNLNPALKEAVEAAGGNIKVTCQPATLAPGEPPKRNE